MSSFGRSLIIIGAIIVALGLLVTFGGRLPGDILIKGKHSAFYFPLAMSLLLSLLLSLVLWLINRR